MSKWRWLKWNSFHTRLLVSYLLLVTLATSLLCAVISHHLARSLSKPVEQMRNFANRVGSGCFSSQLTVRQSNELGATFTICLPL